MGSYSQANMTHSGFSDLSGFSQYQLINYFSKYNLNYLFGNPLFYQNPTSIEGVNFCNFLMYGDNISMRLRMKQVFGFLPDRINRLPLAQREEDFPIEYWTHENMPEAQRRLVDQVIAEINVELEFRAFTIAGIDNNEINSIDNRRDQRNVIYWFNEEEMSILQSDLIYGSGQNLPQFPGMAMQVPNLGVSDLSFYPLFDTDIIINTGSATDLEALKTYLIAKLKEFGFEEPPLNMEGEGLYDLLIEYLENITLEEYRVILIDFQTQVEQMTRQRLNTIRTNEVDLTGEEEAVFNQIIAQVNRYITFLESMNPENLSADITDIRNRFAAMDVAQFQGVSSSIFFKRLLKHELLHGLGLDHDTRRVVSSDLRPLMRPDAIGSVEDILNPEQVDESALRSLSCLYDLDALRRRLPF